jgi:AcrR family transcriptional regulator
MVAVKESTRQPARRRNPRGQGEKLRDDIIEAASRLLADPASPPLTLRGVAREVGVAATSVYLHFTDLESLVVAVADRRFGELIGLQDRALAEAKTPRDRVLAGCLAYCEFGLANPGHYQVMFVSRLPARETHPVEDTPGHQVFQQLVALVAEAIARPPADPAAFATATFIWQQLHGTVTLRISRPNFPWPPLPTSLTEALTRILPPTP